MGIARFGRLWTLALILGAGVALGAEPQFRSVPVPRHIVASLAQDRAGFLWVGTGDGLARFDGYRLHPIERSGVGPVQRSLGWVKALAPARDGRMWIGTESAGLAVYDPERDEVRMMAALDALAGRQPAIRALAEDVQGQVWVATLGAGLFRYEPANDRFVHQDLRWLGQAEDRVLALQLAHDGRLWAGHWLGLSRLDGSHWTAVELPAGSDRATVRSLFEDREGRLWFGTQDGRLGVHEHGRSRWVLSEQGGAVQSIAQGQDGLLWVGLSTGLLWLDPQKAQVRQRLRYQPHQSTGLAGNEVSALLRDRAGAIWIGGYGLGLQRHQQHPALSVRGPDGDAASPLAQADVRSILALRDGRVFAPTHTGAVAILDGRPGKELATLGSWPRGPGPMVESLAEAPDGSIWLVCAGRLEHRAADGKLLRQWPIEGGRAQRVLPRGEGANLEIWLGMQEGLYRLRGPDAAAPERINRRDGSPLRGGINALLDDGPTLWVGGLQGLFRWERDGLDAVQGAPDATLGVPVVLGLLKSRDGTLWLDTPISGLHRLVAWDAQGRARFERISERHGRTGLPYGANLHEDARGRIWSQQFIYDPREQRLDELGPAEGVEFGTPWYFASTALGDGRLLFGGSRGILVVQPQAFTPSHYAPPLVISALRVDGRDHAPGAPGQDLRLPAGARSLGVEFAALDYADPSRLRYQYRLLGLGEDWTAIDASGRFPTFNQLPPGRYTLQVRATNHHSVWNPQLLELPIELLPAWWQTRWAYAGAIALGLLALWAWVRMRTRQLRLREAELQALVDARTVELREASLSDVLTGLRNRRYLDLRINGDLQQCLRRYDKPGPRREDSDLIVLLLDLDHFKHINDLHGHAAGDAVLQQLGQRLRTVFRESDSLVRWGGEEFLALARESVRSHAPDLAARVCSAVRDTPFDLGNGQQMPVTASVGCVVFPLDPEAPQAWDWDATLSLADGALYAAKAQGRDGHVTAWRADGLRPDEAPRTSAAWLQETRLQVVRGSG